MLGQGWGARDPQIHLLPPSPYSKASWKNVGLSGVCVFFGERVKFAFVICNKWLLTNYIRKNICVFSRLDNCSTLTRVFFSSDGRLFVPWWPTGSWKASRTEAHSNCYTELAVSSLAVAVTVADTNCARPRLHGVTRSLAGGQPSRE